MSIDANNACASQKNARVVVICNRAILLLASFGFSVEMANHVLPVLSAMAQETVATITSMSLSVVIVGIVMLHFRKSSSYRNFVTSRLGGVTEFFVTTTIGYFLVPFFGGPDVPKILGNQVSNMICCDCLEAANSLIEQRAG